MQLSLSNMLLVLVVVASIVSAAAIAPQILAPRETQIYQLAVYASSKPHAGGVIVDFKVVNVGQKPVELRKVQVDGGFVEVAPRKRELMPGEVYEDSILLPGLSAGEHSISVEASGGGTPLFESSKFMAGSEAGGGSPQQPKNLHCRVEKRPIYEEVKVKDKVWAVVGHEKVPKYETRAKRVCGIVGYRKEPIYEWRHKKVWSVVGHKKEPIYREETRRVWGVVGYKTVPRYEDVEERVCSWKYRKVPIYRTKRVFVGYYTRRSVYRRWSFWVRRPIYKTVLYFAGYRYIPYYSYRTVHRRVFVGYEKVPIYGWKEIKTRKLVGYKSIPIYGWKNQRYRVLAGYRSVPIHGCWTEYEKVLVGYEEKPIYGWKEVERAEKRLKGYEEVIVCE